MLEMLVLIMVKLPHFIYPAHLTTILFNFYLLYCFTEFCCSLCSFPCPASVHVIFSFSYYNPNLQEQEGLGDPNPVVLKVQSSDQKALLAPPVPIRDLLNQKFSRKDPTICWSLSFRGCSFCQV